MKEIEMINRVAEILGQSGSVAVQHYALWYTIQAIGLIIFGIYVLYKGAILKEIKEWDEDIFPFVKGGLILVGALFIIVNLPDIFSPEGIAIHRLLKDITGS